METKISSLPVTFLSVAKITKNNLWNLIIAIVVMGLVIFLTNSLLTILYQLFLKIQIFSEYLFTYRYLWKYLVGIAYFFIYILKEFYIIKLLLKPQSKTLKILKSVVPFIPRLISLYIILGILFFLATLPIYASILLFVINLNFIGLLSAILGLILTLILASLFVFSPYVMIDNNLDTINSLKKSLSIAKNNLLMIIVKLLIFGILFILLLNFSILFSFYGLIGGIISFILTILLILFLHTFPFALYQEYK